MDLNVIKDATEPDLILIKLAFVYLTVFLLLYANQQLECVQVVNLGLPVQRGGDEHFIFYLQRLDCKIVCFFYCVFVFIARLPKRIDVDVLF